MLLAALVRIRTIANHKEVDSKDREALSNTVVCMLGAQDADRWIGWCCSDRDLCRGDAEAVPAYRQPC
jgi:hypothetical protein